MQMIRFNLGSHDFQTNVSEAIRLWAATTPQSQYDDAALQCVFPTMDFADSYQKMQGGGDGPFGKIATRYNSVTLPRHTGKEIITTVNDATGVTVPAGGTLIVDGYYTTTITDEWYVPVPSELLTHHGKSTAFAHAGNVQLDITFESNWADAIRINHMTSPPNFTSVDMPRFSKVPSLTYWTIKPPRARADLIAKPQHRNYLASIALATPEFGLGPQSVTTTSTNLNAIPSRIVIGVLPERRTMSLSDQLKTPDFYGHFRNLTINFGHTVHFNTLKPHELWRMSNKNGLKMTYNQWINCGGPIIIDIADGDLGVGAQGYVGALTNISFQVIADVECSAKAKLMYQVFYQRTFSSSPNQAAVQTSIDLDTTQVNGLLKRDAQESASDKIGGGFWGNVLDKIKSIAGTVGSVLSVVKMARGGAIIVPSHQTAGGSPPPATVDTAEVIRDTSRSGGGALDALGPKVEPRKKNYE
jgi:hypothetical protein